MFGYKTINLNTQEQQQQQRNTRIIMLPLLLAVLVRPASNMGATFQLLFFAIDRLPFVGST